MKEDKIKFCKLALDHYTLAIKYQNYVNQCASNLTVFFFQFSVNKYTKLSQWAFNCCNGCKSTFQQLGQRKILCVNIVACKLAPNRTQWRQKAQCYRVFKRHTLSQDTIKMFLVTSNFYTARNIKTRVLDCSSKVVA